MANPNSIDGFFLSRRTQPGNRKRPAPDSLSGGKSVHEDKNSLRLERREAAPIGGQSADDFFHAPTASSPISAVHPPEALKGKHDHEEKSRFGGFKKVLGGLRKPSRRTVKRSIIIALIILVLVGGFFAVRFFLAGGQIFKGNVFNAIFAAGKPLKTDADGRTNMVLFGTSEDDPGHEGAELSDSIMLVSIDQKKKEAFLVSMPRDFYVEYGEACNSGYEGKINELYSCGKAIADGDEDAGQKALSDKVGEIFGLEMHYSAHVNYTALKQAVDSVGGITVEIESDDPRGILDRNFDWMCKYQCNLVKHPNGPVELDGEKALALARARGSIAPTYGLGGGNFDREQYQRKILVALKDKAASAGTLANPSAINGLIDALGDNVRTTFDAAEVKTLASLGQDIKGESIRSLSLVNEEDPLVTTGNVAGMSIVQPVAGLSDYSDIRAAVRAYATGDTAYLEGAVVDVLNASGSPGVAQTKADELSNQGITVEVIGNAPEDLNIGSVRLYDLSDGSKPITLKKLQTILGVEAIPELPAGVTSSSDFVIIVGSDGAT